MTDHERLLKELDEDERLSKLPPAERFPEMYALGQRLAIEFEQRVLAILNPTSPNFTWQSQIPQSQSP